MQFKEGSRQCNIFNEIFMLNRKLYKLKIEKKRDFSKYMDIFIFVFLFPSLINILKI